MGKKKYGGIILDQLKKLAPPATGANKFYDGSGIL